MPARKYTTAPVDRVFGKLTVIGYSHAIYKKDRKVPRYMDYWMCRCVCGNERPFEAHAMMNGNAQSCGCANLRNTKHGESGGPRKNTSRQTRSREYAAYAAMKNRCYHPGNSEYHHYGGRGIKVHQAWLDDYLAFLAHVGRKPTPQHSLDRIDNNGNYEPGNVRWATQKQQMENTRLNKWVTYEGEQLTVASLARRKGMNPGTLWTRLVRMKLSLDEALSWTKYSKSKSSSQFPCSPGQHK